MTEITEEQKQEYLKRMQAEAKNIAYEPYEQANDILVEILHKIGGFEEILKVYKEVYKWYNL